MIIRTRAYPRVGFIGNPSDGYYGKTISFAFSNFSAEVILYESPELEILSSEKDQSVFSGIESLVRDVELHGYYGGVRLLKATVKRFYDYCRDNQIELHDKNFTIRYHSNIPHGVGLAGSSAIITACLRAMMTFYGVAIPKPMQASLILSSEKDELRISAGLQDRVIQVYEGMVFMDFDKELMKKQGHGFYEEMDTRLIPKLYVAYRDDLSEPTEVFHNDIRTRFEMKDKAVVSAVNFWSRLTVKARKCLLNKDMKELDKCINANFDRRMKIYKLSKGNIQMVEAARSVGASAKFTGSGGAIVGMYKDEKMYNHLRKEFKKIAVNIIKPKVVNPLRKDMP